MQIADDPAVRKIVQEPEGQIPDRFPSNERTDGELKPQEQLPRSPETTIDPEKYGVENIESIRVKEAWEEAGGNRGEGVIIGHIDSGVLHTHEALHESFVGVDYGWLDAVSNKTEPWFSGDHGTFTLGIIVGTHGIGVAPGSKWISCLACDGGCPGEALLDCLQFMTCPTLPDRTNPDCSRAPQVVSNSWASERGVEDYDDVLLDMRRMGIIPVFGVGNVAAPSCNKTRAPGDRPFVIGVGGGGVRKDGVAGHAGGSAVGPAPDGTIKPDILAPWNVLTSSPYREKYWFSDGTSMSTPHVTGVIALLLAREPTLTYEQVYELLTQNTVRNFTLTDFNKRFYCNETLLAAEKVPNNIMGYGVLDAYNVVKAHSLQLASKTKK